MTAGQDETAATSMMARDRTRAGPMQPLPRRERPAQRRAAGAVPQRPPA